MTIVKGTIRSGCEHFSQKRKGFYAEVVKKLGLQLHPGTINVELHPKEFEALSHRSWVVIPGVDTIDLDANEDLWLIPCQVGSILGVRIIPVLSTLMMGGHPNTIEISLTKELPKGLVKPGQELEVILF